MGNYTHLSMTDRRQLHVFLEMGLSIATIAKRLEKHRSTLYRELNRNQTESHYLLGEAHRKANLRAKRDKTCKLRTDAALYDYVVRHLKLGWSPEQISGRMKLNQKKFYVCHETIYRYIYSEKNKGLYQYLPNKKPKRRQHCARKQQQCRFGEIRLITKRPIQVEQRKRIGHWEGDLIEFSGTKKKTITTLVERKSRIVSLIKNNAKVSAVVMEKIKNKLNDNPSLPCQTITFDQGSEFADYKRIELGTKCKVYYCETRSPWQKGSNENMNGRLRRYLPRSADIDQITQSDLDQLAEKMNNLPRKCLGYLTPKELFLQHQIRSCRT